MLLRGLESKQYTPVGGNESLVSNFRLVAATNRDLKELVKAGTMRSDFFCRRHVLPIHVPPLRGRRRLALARHGCHTGFSASLLLHKIH